MRSSYAEKQGRIIPATVRECEKRTLLMVAHLPAPHLPDSDITSDVSIGGTSDNEPGKHSHPARRHPQKRDDLPRRLPERDGTAEHQRMVRGWPERNHTVPVGKHISDGPPKFQEAATHRDERVGDL